MLSCYHNHIVGESRLTLTAACRAEHENRQKITLVGVYCLAMKSDSGIFRRCASRMKDKGASVVIHQPTLEHGTAFFGSIVVNDLKKRKKTWGCIIANRNDTVQDEVEEKT